MLLVNNIREDIIIQLMDDSLNILILLYISDQRLERKEWKEKKFKKKNTRKKINLHFDNKKRRYRYILCLFEIWMQRLKRKKEETNARGKLTYIDFREDMYICYMSNLNRLFYRDKHVRLNRMLLYLLERRSFDRGTLVVDNLALDLDKPSEKFSRLIRTKGPWRDRSVHKCVFRKWIATPFFENQRDTNCAVDRKKTKIQWRFKRSTLKS